MSMVFRSWDSKSLLLAQIAKGPNSILIGEDIEAPRGYYSHAFTSSESALQVGILVNQEKVPSVLSIPWAALLFFGYDDSISVVDTANGVLVKTLRLEGQFFEFLVLDELQQILVMHELGCVALTNQGNVIWRHSSDDILEDWSTTDEELHLSEMGRSKPVTLSLKTGTQ